MHYPLNWWDSNGAKGFPAYSSRGFRVFEAPKRPMCCHLQWILVHCHTAVAIFRGTDQRVCRAAHNPFSIPEPYRVHDAAWGTNPPDPLTLRPEPFQTQNPHEPSRMSLFNCKTPVLALKARKTIKS